MSPALETKIHLEAASRRKPAQAPRRLRARIDPPYWKSRVLRLEVLGEEDDGLGRWVQDTAY